MTIPNPVILHGYDYFIKQEHANEPLVAATLTLAAHINPITLYGDVLSLYHQWLDQLGRIHTLEAATLTLAQYNQHSNQ